MLPLPGSSFSCPSAPHSVAYFLGVVVRIHVCSPQAYTAAIARVLFPQDSCGHPLGLCYILEYSAHAPWNLTKECLVLSGSRPLPESFSTHWGICMELWPCPLSPVMALSLGGRYQCYCLAPWREARLRGHSSCLRSYSK